MSLTIVDTKKIKWREFPRAEIRGDRPAKGMLAILRGDQFDVIATYAYDVAMDDGLPIASVELRHPYIPGIPAKDQSRPVKVRSLRTHDHAALESLMRHMLWRAQTTPPPRKRRTRA